MSTGTLNVCSGSWYDPGGPAASYGANLSVTQTLCSGSAGSCIIITFTSFNTQAGNDILTIYDGPNNASPLIGVFSGNSNPGTIVSSTGCLTFNFVSDGTTNRAGWAANVSCSSCGSLIEMDNPTTNFNFCSGLFYDSGGSGASYGANENLTKTFCSNTQGSCLQVQFSSFDLGRNDVLRIYNGATAAAPLVGTYNDVTSPPSTLLSSGGCLTFVFTSDGTNFGAGWAAAISCEPCPIPPAATATYLQPLSGLQSTYVGTNMVNTCGATFTDNGGLGGNYSDNINRVYRTFCPTTPRSCMRATFWDFNVNSASGDYLEVRNGPTQNSTVMSRLAGGPVSSYSSLIGQGAGPFVSTDQSGCLTFTFLSGAATNASGWVITLDCVPCANGPSGTDNSDCSKASGICVDQSFSDASTGPGLVSDGGGGCVLAENFSNWYKLIVSSSGTLALNITPVTAADDYDFALYAATSCASLGSPVRCSYAANVGNTGMNSALNLSTNTAAPLGNNSGSDSTEDVRGNGWVNDLPVLAGQTYYLLVNKWSPSGDGFTLDWNLSNGASLNCNVLPVELLSFNAVPNGEVVDLEWVTASETNNDFFTVERSLDGKQFEPIQNVRGAGTISYERAYLTIDPQPYKGVSYYRLKQTDFDGKYSYSDVVAVRMGTGRNFFQLVPNPAVEDFSILFSDSKAFNRTIRIHDLSGRLVFQQVINEETTSFRIDASELSKGMYYVSVTDSSSTDTLPLVLR